MPRRCPRCRCLSESDVCGRCGRYTLPINICPKCFNEKQERNEGHRIITVASRFTKDGEFAWAYDPVEKKRHYLYECNVCKYVFRGESVE